MSGKNNVNPDHYRIAGRDRPNETLRPRTLKPDPAPPARAGKKRPAAPNFIPGAPARRVRPRARRNAA